MYKRQLQDNSTSSIVKIWSYTTDDIKSVYQASANSGLNGSKNFVADSVLYDRILPNFKITDQLEIKNAGGTTTATCLGRRFSGAVGINYDDALITNFTLSNLGFISASAIFPEQEIYVKKEEQIIDLDPIQLKEVKIKSGTVTINVLSTLPNGKLIYKIPSLKKNGISFNSGDIIVPENTSATLTQYFFNFDNYWLCSFFDSH